MSMNASSKKLVRLCGAKLVAFALLLIAPFVLAAPSMSSASSEFVLFDWTRDQTASGWSAVDDRVMGGISRSRMRWDTAGHAVFEGRVSLENNGGFASVRTVVASPIPSDKDTFMVRVRGDGKRYALMVRTDRTFEGVAYHAGFVAPASSSATDGWTTVRLERSKFVAKFRGRLVNAPPLKLEHVKQIGFMVSDGQAGEFRLDVQTIAIGDDKRRSN
jgi:NADH dehydrogenase [ubiquinone] 1 alpha subcomplex assembly factor 1